MNSRALAAARAPAQGRRSRRLRSPHRRVCRLPWQARNNRERASVHRLVIQHIQRSGSDAMKVFVFGTLKRGFPLHHGMTGALFLGRYQTVRPFPMFVAGPWFAPMMMNEPGVGHHVIGELYDADEVQLARLDAMESLGKPGNFRT